MDKNLEEFLNVECKSKAKLIDSRNVEVIAPDGEVFQMICFIGQYISEDTRKYYLHLIEAIFDECYSANKEQMVDNIWRATIRNAVPIRGMDCGNRQNERVRMGERIRQIRSERNIEARELAKLAGIDAANLSRIENGKYSVGFDILSKIATVLGKKLDLVDL